MLLENLGLVMCGCLCLVAAIVLVMVAMGVAAASTARQWPTDNQRSQGSPGLRPSPPGG